MLTIPQVWNDLLLQRLGCSPRLHPSCPDLDGARSWRDDDRNGGIYEMGKGLQEDDCGKQATLLQLNGEEKELLVYLF